jgi:NTE family protein
MLSRITLIIPFLLASLGFIQAQTVGVVFSGGGASGLAHVGVLKALEENDIPIDFIAGTSIGAFVGGMYAAGYSPEEIELIVTSNYYRSLAEGQIEDKYIYYFRKPIPNASWFSFRLSSDSNFLNTSLPTSFIDPSSLDIEMLAMFEPASQMAGYDFDSLFVPFRCVAANIEDKESKIFRSGNLNQSIRASMSYPLYLEPITIDNKLLFDGGLYNNFPTDVMRDDFQPDVIIGCNVSSNEAPPREGDALSQLRNMVVSKTNYELESECCVLIEPKVNYGTFDFKHTQENVDSGYIAAIRLIEDIKSKVDRRVEKQVVMEKRKSYNDAKIPLNFGELDYEGLSKSQSAYVGLILKPSNKEDLSFDKLKKGYYRLLESDKVDRIFPTADGLSSDSTYKLHLTVRKEKNLLLEVGGNLSSRPINTGYVGIGYAAMNNTGSSFYANTYFGKLYNSLLGMGRIDIPVRLPIFFEMKGVLSRWNYFESRANFFEDNNSLFLIQNGQFFRGDLALALSNKTKLTLGGGALSLKDDYFQTPNFGEDSQKDITVFRGTTFSAAFEKNSLTDKLYANSGSFLRVSFRYVEGEEKYTPGSTSLDQVGSTSIHDWVDLKLSYDNYYKGDGFIRLGVYAEGVYSTQRLFSNYSASQLRSPAFQPTPESQTLFLESFRAYKYAGIGHKAIFNIYKNFDLRLEGYLFKPFEYADIITDINDLDFDGNVEEELFIRNEAPNLIGSQYFTIATANAVYRSPLGPVSLSVNYYYNLPEISVYKENQPITIFFHFGYILFNDRALQ